MHQPKIVSIIGKSEGWRLAPDDVESWGATQLILQRDVDRVVDMNVYFKDGIYPWGEEEANHARVAKARAKTIDAV